MDKAVAHLLDFSKEFDITLLDQIIDIAYASSHSQRAAANEFLVQIKEHPDMWKRCDAIIEKSKQMTTKLYGLQILQDTITVRWKILPMEQREGIKNYILTKILALANTPNLSPDYQLFLNRLNLALVAIVKQDWPDHWPNFIHDLIESSKISEILCENNMKILLLLSEEVFDYSIESMTAAKTKSLKISLNNEFRDIFQLCEIVLNVSTSKSLLLTTLKTLERFLTWIPLGYIFETPLLECLVTKFFPHQDFR